MGKFDYLTPGAGQEPDAGGYDVEEGRILDVSTAGATVELVAHPKVSWGPAPWSLGLYGSVSAAITAGFAPQVGDRCLVAFAGADHTPWLLAWTR